LLDLNLTIYLNYLETQIEKIQLSLEFQIY